MHDYMNRKYSSLCLAEHYITRSRGDFIIMNVNTLDIYFLDEAEKDIIRTYIKSKCISDQELSVLEAKYGELVIAAKIDELLENGILKKKEAKDKSNAKPTAYDKNSLSVINAIDIFISDDCNLACKYCFAGKVRRYGKTALMTPDTGEKVVDFLIRRSGGKKDLFICFFGGEPLINFKVLEHIVTYALEEERRNNRNFHFSLTTNGTLLSDEIIDFIEAHKINVLISIDGEMRSHNLNRPMQGKKDSYTEIVANLEKLNRRNINYSARATVSSYTKNRIAENYQHLVSLGFKMIHFENALAPKGKVFITGEKDIKEIKKQYSLIAKRVNSNIISGQPYNLETIPLPLERIMERQPGFYSCTAGKGYVAVDTKGDIYLCHRLTGDENFLLGNVIEDTYDVKWSEAINRDMNIENRKRCRKCQVRYLCGGGCYAINYDFNKNISLAPGIYCRLMKHSIKSALSIYANAARQLEKMVK